MCCPVPGCPSMLFRGRQSTVCEGLDLRQTGSQSLSSQQPTSLSATLAATKSIMFGLLCHFPHHGVRREGEWGRCLLPSFNRSPPELEWRVFSPADAKKKRERFLFFYLFRKKTSDKPGCILGGLGWGGVWGGKGGGVRRREAVVVVVAVAMPLPRQDDSLYHSVVGAQGLLVTDAHGVLPPTRPVLLFPQRFPANGHGHFHRVRMTSCRPDTLSRPLTFRRDSISRAPLFGGQTCRRFSAILSNKLPLFVFSFLFKGHFLLGDDPRCIAVVV